MKTNIQTILTDVNEQLLQLNSEITDPSLLAEAVTQLIKSTIQQIDESIISDGFPSLKDEIHFFKIEKPKLMSMLFFHNCVYKLEAFKPKNGKKEIKEYLMSKKVELNLFSVENYEFYKYHHTESTRFDPVYFVRCQFDIKNCITCMFLMVDERICTYHCFLTAKILANIRFSAYVDNSLCKQKVIPIPTSTVSIEGSTNDKLTWTRSKTELIELTYSLIAAKVFNNGKIESKKIFKAIEVFFHIDLGQNASTKIDIENRKTGKTKFIDCIKECLLQSFEED